MRGGKSAFPGLTALQAQRLVERVALDLAPALAAGALATVYLHGVGRGLLVGSAVLAAGLLLTRNRYPLHLMPLAGLVVRVAIPVLGCALAFAVLAAAGRPAPPVALLAPIVAAWLVTGAAVWAKLHFDAVFPVRLAVIGSPRVAIGLADELKAAGIPGYVVAGWLADDEPAAEAPASRPRRLGALEQVREVVERERVDLLVHSLRRSTGGESGSFPSRLELFDRLAADCLGLPVRLIEAGQFYEEQLGHVPLGQSNSAWFQYLMHPRYRAASAAYKRAFDLLVAGLMLVVLSPVLAAFAIVVKLTDGGPVFYRQRRVGEHGREFELIKLRSMRSDSEGVGARWAEADDDRVTAVGKVMRRLHIDEMPQLWNILRGDMTLVGPRPERREMIASLEGRLPYYDRRHLVKPGLAGWAQARCGYGGSEEGTSWKLCHDLFYLKHRSIYFDALILIENVRVSLKSGVQFGVREPRTEFILGRPAA
jgi:exopolysaccharide biosynthesis polyprenyl glycosylphosphotransferase